MTPAEIMIFRKLPVGMFTAARYRTVVNYLQVPKTRIYKLPLREIS